MTNCSPSSDLRAARSHLCCVGPSSGYLFGHPLVQKVFLKVFLDRCCQTLGNLASSFEVGLIHLGFCKDGSKQIFGLVVEVNKPLQDGW